MANRTAAGSAPRGRRRETPPVRRLAALGARAALSADCRASAAVSLAVSLSLGPPLFDPGVQAQEPDGAGETVQVTARVRDARTRTPLLGALIELSGLSRRYVTGVDGEVAFELPPGHYTFTAHKGGYATLRGDFGVVGASVLTLAMHETGDVDTTVPGRLLVRVAEFGSGRLIEGAAVSLPGGEGRLTDGSGWVEFSDLTGPDAEITVEMLGYRKRTEPVALREGRTTVVEMAMSIDAVVLAPIEVEVRSGFLEAQGVYWRMEHNRTMHVFDGEDLIERGGRPYLTEAFRRLPGVTVLGMGEITGPRGCELAVYWDGRPAEVTIPWALDEIPPEEVELVEVYTGIRTPLRFSRGGGDINTCGAIVFWSRRRADRSR